MTLKNLIKCFLTAGVFALIGTDAHAQNNLLQNTIDKIESYNNFSYKYVYKQKEVFSDTLIIPQKVNLLKMREDKLLGFYFRNEIQYTGNKNLSIDMYNGKDLIALNPADSTYTIESKKALNFNRLLPGQLNWIRNFSHKHPSSLIKSTDTVINTINCYHLILNTRDTIINKDHLYTRQHLFIDKKTELPVAILTRAKTAEFGKEAVDYYVQENYYDFDVELKNIDTAFFSIPVGFKLHQKKEQSALLPPGTIAPDWTLYNTAGKKTSLSQLKGKVILLDFFFVGCTGCMQTLAPLDRLYEKYRNDNFVLLSISQRDNKQLVTAFKNSQKIKNPMFPSGQYVTKLYQATAFPTFYLIDRDGRIADVLVGYSDDFENKLSAAIERLMK
jgi:peroxiredoxin